MTHEMSVADMEVLAQAFPKAFPSKGVQLAARRALRRLVETIDKSPSRITADDLIGLYREAVAPAVSVRAARNECGAMKHLAGLPSLPRETIDRIWRSEATLADAITVITAQDIGPEATRIAGALTRYAQYHHKQPEDIPAVERTIGESLDRLQAADFDLTLRSYQTFCSRIRRAVRLVDRHAHTRISCEALSGPWRDVSDRVYAHHSELRGDLAKLWSLITYCWSRSIEPAHVDDQVIADLWSYLERHDVVGPFQRVRATVYAWERLQRHVPGWPTQVLKRLYSNGQTERISARMEDLPPKVQQLWTSFEDARRAQELPTSAVDLICVPDDPFAGFEAGRGSSLSKGYKKASLASLQAHWLVCVKAHLEETGEFPARLSDVTELDTLKSVIRAIAARDKVRAEKAGKPAPRKTSYRKAIVTSALSWARYDGCAPEHLEDLEDLRDHLDPHLKGLPKLNAKGKKVRSFVDDLMGERHKERLAQFRNPRHMAAWHELPDNLVFLAKKRLDKSALDAQATNMVIVALTHRILRCVPMRRSNLAGLRLTGPRPQIALPFHGRGSGRIEIDWLEVKNERAITVTLDQETVALMHWWIRELRPRLMKRVGSNPDNIYLFPAKEDGHRANETLNARFRQYNERYGGFIMNLHLARHLTAKVILDEDWSQIELVRQLLGHEDRKTTEKFYAEAGELLAQKRWHEILDESRRKNIGKLKRQGKAA